MLYGGEPPVEVYPSKDRNRIIQQQRELRSVRPIANVSREEQA